ncbi:dihydroxyacetone kinase subunit L [Rhodovastum atsumiense]|uniref:Dihydroxyacetone kinase subunit L n=1 Tax=Rhodovastum atsumiense TaxID=504468 RepID=A0A5M6IND9_9PROT|nr:dihydroxyacetone kinase subunit DhaL [Rhodovastum atsumiense]KAA5609507.1 dihydroxyacetone kinase subunit L [Rhodovastum atsumiense]CAH2600790.1 dihydroxyacetone kinase subunit L [Rhodovastum atsumiense]
MAEAITLPVATDWLNRLAARYATERDWLVELDSAIGDGDHGANLARGFAAVRDKLQAAPPADVAALFRLVGMTLISTVGGASGPLYGTLFLEAGKKAAGAASLDVAGWRACLEAGVAGIRARGKAEAGEKTMLDALLPAVAALDGTALPAALLASAAAATHGSDATIPLIARKGRASYLGERSVGHRDPGAASSVMLLDELAQAAA